MLCATSSSTTLTMRTTMIKSFIMADMANLITSQNMSQSSLANMTATAVMAMMITVMVMVTTTMTIITSTVATEMDSSPNTKVKVSALMI